MDILNLTVWQLHPQACRVEPAEKTLRGTAHEGGVKWCHPFSTANRLGWWLFPPIDIDIRWTGCQFEHQQLEEYSDFDYHHLRKLIKPEDGVDPDKWCVQGGRTKFSFGGVEKNVVQIWTGLIFQTPPGWSLQIRSPVNCKRQPFYVMEGILESDWMQYDIWTNLVFDRENEWAHLRKDGWPPLAMITPVRRETYESEWKCTAKMLDRDTPEGNRTFEYYAQYNHKKFGCGGKQLMSRYDPNLTKDSTTFYRERKRLLGDDKLPIQPEPNPPEPKCPFHKNGKITPHFVPVKPQ